MTNYSKTFEDEINILIDKFLKDILEKYEEFLAQLGSNGHTDVLKPYFIFWIYLNYVIDENLGHYNVLKKSYKSKSEDPVDERFNQIFNRKYDDLKTYLEKFAKLYTTTQPHLYQNIYDQISTYYDEIKFDDIERDFEAIFQEYFKI